MLTTAARRSPVIPPGGWAAAAGRRVVTATRGWLSPVCGPRSAAARLRTSVGSRTLTAAARRSPVPRPGGWAVVVGRWAATARRGRRSPVCGPWLAAVAALLRSGGDAGDGDGTVVALRRWSATRERNSPSVAREAVEGGSGSPPEAGRGWW